VKLETQTSIPVKNLQQQAEKILDIIPAEHLRGLSKIMFVDLITEPRIPASQRATLPALYHPKMPGALAWGEVAVSVLKPKEKLLKRLVSRMAFKSNLAQVLLSIAAQHYHMTLSKGIKKNQLEPACRQYIEKYFEVWREKQGGLRVKLLKPFKPSLDRMAKKLAKKYQKELEKTKAKQK
jgi:hypothetical protein